MCCPSPNGHVTHAHPSLGLELVSHSFIQKAWAARFFGFCPHFAIESAFAPEIESIDPRTGIRYVDARRREGRHAPRPPAGPASREPPHLVGLLPRRDLSPNRHSNEPNRHPPCRAPDPFRLKPSTVHERARFGSGWRGVNCILYWLHIEVRSMVDRLAARVPKAWPAQLQSRRRPSFAESRPPAPNVFSL